MESEEIISAFNICHDGTIESVQYKDNTLTMEIEIDYLTSRFQTKTKCLLFEILGVTNLSFETWPRRMGENPNILIEPEMIFKFPLDILSAERKENKISVYVKVGTPEAEYSGGLLWFNATTIKIKTSEGDPLLIPEMEKICKEYWDEFGNK